MTPDKVREFEVRIIVITALLFFAGLLTSAHCQSTLIQHVVILESEGEK